MDKIHIFAELDSEKELTRIGKSLDMALVLWDITHNMRKRIEGRLDSVRAVDAEYAGVDLVFKKIQSKLEEHGINTEDLVD